MMTVVYVPQAVAKPQYLAALQFVYGVGSCTTCHIDKSGGKSLTEYGSKFGAQSIYRKDSVIALRAIGEPPGTTPAKTSVVATVIPVGVTAVEVTPVEVTPIATETIVITDITPVVAAHDISAIGNKSPGFDMVDIMNTIGIISAIYILTKWKTGRQ
jgi:hypothetical protein